MSVPNGPTVPRFTVYRDVAADESSDPKESQIRAGDAPLVPRLHQQRASNASLISCGLGSNGGRVLQTVSANSGASSERVYETDGDDAAVPYVVVEQASTIVPLPWWIKGGQFSLPKLNALAVLSGLRGGSTSLTYESVMAKTDFALENWPSDAKTINVSRKMVRLA